MKKMMLVMSATVITLLMSIQSYSSVTRYLSLQELCFHSDTIVEAKVVSLKSFYYGEKNPKIFTSIKLQIFKSYYGDCKTNDIIEIVRYGGTIGEKTTFQVDEPVFIKDQSSVLFLKSYTSEIWGHNYYVYGLSEGKFNIKNETIYRDNTVGSLFLYRNGIHLPISNKAGMDKEIFISHINHYIH